MKTNTVKSTKKPAFVVNMIDANTPEDVKFQFIYAKAKAGIPIRKDDVNFLISYGAMLTLNAFDECIDNYCKNSKTFVVTDDKLVKEITNLVIDTVAPKKPWYKRFWAWITKPFRKNK